MEADVTTAYCTNSTLQNERHCITSPTMRLPYRFFFTDLCCFSLATACFFWPLYAVSGAGAGFLLSILEMMAATPRSTSPFVANFELTAVLEPGSPAFRDTLMQPRGAGNIDTDDCKHGSDFMGSANIPVYPICFRAMNISSRVGPGTALQRDIFRPCSGVKLLSRYCGKIV